MKKRKIRVAIAFDNFGQWAVSQQLVNPDKPWTLSQEHQNKHREGNAKSLLKQLGDRPSLAIDVAWAEVEVTLPDVVPAIADSLAKERLDKLEKDRQEIESKINQIKSWELENSNG